MAASLLRMIAFNCALIPSLQAAAAASASWCGGVPPPKLAVDASIDVYFAQSPLHSTKPGMDILKYFNFFHTAVIFHEPVADQYWTLEFDQVLANSMFPKVNWSGARGSELTFERNEARWCLWSGIYNGRDHWQTAFLNVATLRPSEFSGLFRDLVVPLNRSFSNPHAWPTYNGFYVSTQQGDEIQDVTCGTGVTWVFNYISGQLGAPVAPFDGSVSRVKVNASAMELVDTDDADAWCEMVNYFDLQDQAVRGSHTTNERLSIIGRMLPLKYAFDGNRNAYFKLIGNDHIFEVVKEETRDVQPWPTYACTSNCEPPRGPAVQCTRTTTTTAGPVPASDQVCGQPATCGVSFDVCCFERALRGQPCGCHLQNASTGLDGKGGRAGDGCGICGLAYAECCTAGAIGGSPCDCDVEMPAKRFVL